MPNEVKVEVGCKSLEAFISGALTEAAEAHRACCHAQAGQWEAFYAAHVARRLRPLLCAIQSFVDARLAQGVRAAIRQAEEAVAVEAAGAVVATVRGHWDAQTIQEAIRESRQDAFQHGREVHEQDAGPSWFLR